MADYRFHPLAEYPNDGILELPGRKLVIAYFLTPKEAKDRADRPTRKASR